MGSGGLTKEDTGKYEFSASAASKAVSSRDLLRDGFVVIGVILSDGVQAVEWLAYEVGEGGRSVSMLVAVSKAMFGVLSRVI